jgi:hypothetical protein
MMSTEPMVKQMANLEGARMMTGRNRENARMRKTAPLPSNARNHVKCVVDGIEDCALHDRRADKAQIPGSSARTQLHTSLKPFRL